MHLQPTHVPGRLNDWADDLSQGRLHRFKNRSLCAPRIRPVRCNPAVQGVVWSATQLAQLFPGLLGTLDNSSCSRCSVPWRQCCFLRKKPLDLRGSLLFGFKLGEAQQALTDTRCHSSRTPQPEILSERERSVFWVGRAPLFMAVPSWLEAVNRILTEQDSNLLDFSGCLVETWVSQLALTSDSLVCFCCAEDGLCCVFCFAVVSRCF